jgi:BlaI family transcriptional regulator, penicillinase repressor
VTDNNLGPLEADIMSIIWERKQATVQDIYEELLKDRNIAYNTVMTVMMRLAQKEILNREKDGRAFIYFPITSKKEVGLGMLNYIIDKVFGGSKKPILSQLIDEDTITEEELHFLEELVAKKKSEVRKDGDNQSPLVR